MPTVASNNPVTSTTELTNGAAQTDVHMAYMRDSITQLHNALARDDIPLAKYVQDLIQVLADRAEALAEHSTLAVTDARRETQAVASVSLERHSDVVKLIDGIRLDLSSSVVDARRDNEQVSQVCRERHNISIAGMDKLENHFESRLAQSIRDRVEHYENLRSSMSDFNHALERVKQTFNDRFDAILADARRESERINVVSIERHDDVSKSISDLDRQMNLFMTRASDTLADKFKAIEKGTDLARESIAKEFEGVNEFRGQLKDQAATFITRTESVTTIGAVDQRVSTLERALANYEGRMLMVGLLAAALPTVVSVLLHFLR